MNPLYVPKTMSSSLAVLRLPSNVITNAWVSLHGHYLSTARLTFTAPSSNLVLWQSNFMWMDGWMDVRTVCAGEFRSCGCSYSQFPGMEAIDRYYETVIIRVCKCVSPLSVRPSVHLWPIPHQLLNLWKISWKASVEKLEKIKFWMYFREFMTFGHI